MLISRLHRGHGKETEMLDGLRSQRQLALFFCAWLAFNFPLLALWDHKISLAGIPMFPLAIFILWGLLIAGIAVLMECGPHDSGGT
jgi:hypothetical protein